MGVLPDHFRHPMKRKLGESHKRFGRVVNGKLSLLLSDTTLIAQPLFISCIIT
jgi:hypothetical protein